MIKAIKTFALILVTTLILTSVTYGTGDGNIDAGGGDMGLGTSTNVWSPGNDGVRVTVIRSSDKAIVTSPIDLTNKTPNNIQMHFGKVSKMHYKNGSNLTPQTNTYQYYNPGQAMPRIISTDGSSNIPAIKSYFTDEQVIRSIATIVGMDFDILTNGEYRLLLEPMAYYKFEGVMIATTATEAAMYDEIVSGLLRQKMTSLTHKNLPLAMFLERPDLGYPAWSGSRTTTASNANIKSSLGLGIVRFNDVPPEEPILSTYDYEYRVGTEVITSVRVSGGQSDPNRPARVSFRIGGITYNVGNVYYPNGDSQLAWIKWTTPSTPQEMVIEVSVTGTGSPSKSNIHVRIVDLDENPPPNPVADDRNNAFSYVSVPIRHEQISANWSVWRPWWRANWVWISTGLYSGFWVDYGWWEFNLDKYYATFTANMTIVPDSKNPTANGQSMKSGYGIDQIVAASITSNQSTAVTSPQNAVSYFPEFQYQTYCRLLERVQSGPSARFEFQSNHFSTYKNRTHFTPIWMPDGPYTVNTWALDAWTPVGMLSMNLTDSLTIRGSLWDDWKVSPLKP